MHDPAAPASESDERKFSGRWYRRIDSAAADVDDMIEYRTRHGRYWGRVSKVGTGKSTGKVRTKEIKYRRSVIRPSRLVDESTIMSAWRRGRCE